jgi:hypothetical protein
LRAPVGLSARQRTITKIKLHNLLVQFDLVLILKRLPVPQVCSLTLYLETRGPPAAPIIAQTSALAMNVQFEFMSRRPVTLNFGDKKILRIDRNKFEKLWQINKMLLSLHHEYDCNNKEEDQSRLYVDLV